MAIKVGISGFGRIGRVVIRSNVKTFQFLQINELHFNYYIKRELWR